MIQLRPIREDNFRQCLALDPAPAGPEFVDSVAESLAEAWLYYADTRPVAIYSGEALAGFASLYLGEDNPQIVNFLIDAPMQGRGLGTAAAGACLNLLRETYGAKRVSVPVALENAGALRFWARLGFSPSSSIEDGYIFLRKTL